MRIEKWKTQFTKYDYYKTYGKVVKIHQNIIQKFVQNNVCLFRILSEPKLGYLELH